MDLDGGDPRAMLPNELWFQILENLAGDNDPRDLIYAAESCSHFQDILCDHVNSHRLAEVMPLLLKWLGPRDRLNCRCVSKRMTRSVDSILDNLVRVAPNQHLGLFQSRFMPPTRPSSNFEKTHFDFSRARCIEVYWRTRVDVEPFNREAAESCSGHPVIGASLCLMPFYEVKDNPDPIARLADGKQFLSECLQLLPDYRSAIRHLTLCGGRFTGNLIETYDVRRRIFASLPNLCFFREIGSDPQGLSRVAENLTSLGRHIAVNPMPVIGFLEAISLFETNHPTPAPMVQEISNRYGDKLKRLSTRQAAGVPESGDAQALLVFPELTHLTMTNCPADRESDKRPAIILMNIQANNLVDLRLVIGMQSPTGSMLPEVVQYLARFPRLISLYLDMPYLLLNGLESKTILAGARCPSVKEFKVTTRHSQLPLAFFTELFSNLESFHFGGYFKNNDTRWNYGEFREDFQLLMSQRGFECDVWERCPSLKRLRFRGDHELVSIYTREGDKKSGNRSRRQQNLRN